MRRSLLTALLLSSITPLGCSPDLPSSPPTRQQHGAAGPGSPRQLSKADYASTRALVACRVVADGPQADAAAITAAVLAERGVTAQDFTLADQRAAQAERQGELAIRALIEEAIAQRCPDSKAQALSLLDPEAPTVTTPPRSDSEPTEAGAAQP